MAMTIDEIGLLTPEAAREMLKDGPVLEEAERALLERRANGEMLIHPTGSLDLAVEALGPSPVPDPARAPGLDEIHAALQEHHADHPQRASVAAAALDEVRGALARLAALGHRFMLVVAPPPVPVEYPTMLYRVGAELVVTNQSELETALKDGWHKGPEAEPEEVVPLSDEEPSAAPTFRPETNNLGPGSEESSS
jgi:hypothetical protein